MITLYLSYILMDKIINQFNEQFSAWQFTSLLATFKNDVMLRRWNDAWHHHSGLPRNVVSRTTQLHPSRPRGKKLSRRLRKYRQGKKSKKVSNFEEKKKFKPRFTCENGGKNVEVLSAGIFKQKLTFVLFLLRALILLWKSLFLQLSEFRWHFTVLVSSVC